MEGREVSRVAYGRPALERLAAQVVALKAGDPLAPVTVVVSSNYAAVAARRALAARPGGIANVTFLTLYRLAERLGATEMSAQGRLPVSLPVIAAAVRAVLDEAPGVFAPVAAHPATEQALVAAHRELRSVTGGALDALAGCSQRAADVVRIHRAFQDRLRADWFDEHDLLLAAADVARNGADPGPVIVHLLAELSAAAADLLRAMPLAAVNIGITGDGDADRPVLAAHARAGIEPDHPAAVEPARAARIVSASDPDDEVRAAVRLVTRWMHEGVNLGGVAVLYGLPDPYARLLHEQLTAAGIPWNGVPVRDVGDLLFGRTLQALLALPDNDFRRADVLGVLTGAHLVDGDRPVPGRAWERLSRAAGVVGGDDWDHRLATYAGGSRDEAARREADDPDDWRAGRARREADQADALSAFVARLRTDLDAGDRAGSWAAMVEWAKGLITTYLGDDSRRSDWPEDERQAADRVDAALERLAGLDALEGTPPTLEVFRRALTSELASAVHRVGRLGDGVLTGHASMAAGLVLDKVIVLGMAEGVFPPRRLEDSLLPDAERAVTGGELALRADRVHDDRRHLLAAVAAAGEAVLCQPRGDLRRSGERPASRWLVADAARLAGQPALRSQDIAGHHGAPWLELVPSFAGGLAALDRPATGQDLRLAAIARGALDHPALSDGPLVAALDVVRSRRSDRFTRFDGNVATVASELGLPARTSATRLQVWAECPHRYFVQYVLGAEPLEEPGRLYEITPLDKGTLVHEILDAFVTGALESGHPLERWSEADRARLHAVAEEWFARFEAEGRTGRALFWRRDRGQILADLDRFLDDDDRRLAAGNRPLHTELRFEDLPVPLPGGRELVVSGAIDRVDRRPDGSLAVIDYKTGGSKSYKDLCEAEPHDRGTHLQLYLYALAAERQWPTGRPVRSSYWFNTSKGGHKRIGYDVTPEVADEVAGAIDRIVEGIAAGVFPAHPAEPTGWSFGRQCAFCSPDGGSVTERYREWERKRLDPAVAGYTALAEPEVLDDLA